MVRDNGEEAPIVFVIGGVVFIVAGLFGVVSGYGLLAWLVVVIALVFLVLGLLSLTSKR